MAFFTVCSRPARIQASESCPTPAEWLTFVLESLKFVFLQLAVKIVFR